MPQIKANMLIYQCFQEKSVKVGIRKHIEDGLETLEAVETESGRLIIVKLEVTDRERKILLAGGLINLARH